MLTDYLLSLIRTWVPVGVGAALTWLAMHFNIVLDADMSTTAATVATGLIVGAYYALVRALETQWPGFGRLLGKKAGVTYLKH